MADLYKMLVLSAPTESQDAEYNRWYDEVHLGEVLSVPGFVRAQRFRLAEPLSGGTPYPYATIYEIETDALEESLGELKRRAGSGELTMSPAIDTAGSYAMVYTPAGPVCTPR